MHAFFLPKSDLADAPAPPVVIEAVRSAPEASPRPEAHRPLFLRRQQPHGDPIEAAPVFRVEHPLANSETRVDWIAERVLAAGEPFRDMVQVPSQEGHGGRRASVAAPDAIAYSTFRSVIERMLAVSPEVVAHCIPNDLVTQMTFDTANAHARTKVEQGGQTVATLLVHFWRAVSSAYSQAWNLEPSGLLRNGDALFALAEWGAAVVDDSVHSYNLRQRHFDEVVRFVADGVPLDGESAHLATGTGHPDRLGDRVRERWEAYLAQRSAVAVPGTVGSIDWGSGVAPASPDVDVDGRTGH